MKGTLNEGKKKKKKERKQAVVVQVSTEVSGLAVEFYKRRTGVLPLASGIM